MEENKNLTPKAKEPKIKKEKKLKNQAFLKKGSYSLAITAIVIAAIIVVNILVGALSSRFVLEFDMTTDKVSSIDEENIEYIKGVENEVEVIVCADEDGYVGGYMEYYARAYNVSDSAAGTYYEQTVKLINRYNDYNKKIKVSFIDPQSSEFSAIASKYSNDDLAYGDIIVSAETDGVKRHKILGYTDIYNLTEDSSYSMYGYSMNIVSGNKIETALTSAIDYVTSNETKKIAVFTGHSSKDYTTEYISLLKDNNYDITVFEDKIISKISNEFDALMIAAPTIDFAGSEIDAIAEFLDNNSKYGKGFLFFADVNSPYLTNLYDFLAQWGITVEDGVVYETAEGNHLANDPLSLGSYSSGNDDISKNIPVVLTSNNIPLSAEFEKEGIYTVTSLIATPETTVAAPKGTTAGWGDAGNYEKQSYSTVIQSQKTEYDEDSNPMNSYVLAFSSTDFITLNQSEQYNIYSKQISLSAAERAVGADASDIYFYSKTISNESFQPSESAANAVEIIFIYVIPILIIAASIYVYIKRRNA